MGEVQEKKLVQGTSFLMIVMDSDTNVSTSKFVTLFDLVSFMLRAIINIF